MKNNEITVNQLKSLARDNMNKAASSWLSRKYWTDEEWYCLFPMSTKLFGPWHLQDGVKWVPKDPAQCNLSLDHVLRAAVEVLFTKNVQEDRPLLVSDGFHIGASLDCFTARVSEVIDYFGDVPGRAGSAQRTKEQLSTQVRALLQSYDKVELTPQENIDDLPRRADAIGAIVGSIDPFFQAHCQSYSKVLFLKYRHAFMDKDESDYHLSADDAYASSKRLAAVIASGRDKDNHGSGLVLRGLVGDAIWSISNDATGANSVGAVLQLLDQRLYDEHKNVLAKNPHAAARIVTDLRSLEGSHTLEAAFSCGLNSTPREKAVAQLSARVVPAPVNTESAQKQSFGIWSKISGFFSAVFGWLAGACKALIFLPAKLWRAIWPTMQPERAERTPVTSAGMSSGGRVAIAASSTQKKVTSSQYTAGPSSTV